MQEENGLKSWQEILDFPLAGRCAKPRRHGLTMVMDKGLGLTQTGELLETAAGYVDFIKLGFGTSALYSVKLLREKIALIRSYGVDVYPGGTFLEVAMLQGKLGAYLEISRELGYTFVEVSDGTIEMTPKERAGAIIAAREAGFQVISEVGKKDTRDQVSTRQMRAQIEDDLACGVYKVIVEGRESGRSVAIYDSKGDIKENELAELVKGVRDMDTILWEAPSKQQQQELIIRFGPNVNMGNVQPADVLALEALRVGLRGDTLRMTLRPRMAEVLPYSMC